jgi:DNA repair protein RadC
MSSRKQRLEALSGNWIASEISVQYKLGFICENPLNNIGDAYSLFLSIWDRERITFQEQFVALFLNVRGKIVGYKVICTGRLESTTVDVRLIASLALHTLSASVIVAHNHPSRHLEPSDADIGITKKLKKALNLIDVKLLDHLIICESGYRSIDVEKLQ